MNQRVANVLLNRWENGHFTTPENDRVAIEEPLEIRIHGEPVVTLMRTPGDDRDLVAGFLVTEGIVRERRDIIEIAPCPYPSAERAGNILNVTLASDTSFDLRELRRHIVASSSCGICSKTSIASVRRRFPAVQSDSRVSARVIQELPERLRASQSTFMQTGGLHATAWFDPQGNLLTLREDVGRHNALDKVIGHRFLEDFFASTEGILLVSGRVAFEIVQKALAAHFPIIVAISAPTSLAIEFANENRQTLVGFLRNGRMNIYTHPQRIEN